MTVGDLFQITGKAISKSLSLKDAPGPSQDVRRRFSMVGAWLAREETPIPQDWFHKTKKHTQ